MKKRKNFFVTIISFLIIPLISMADEGKTIDEVLQSIRQSQDVEKNEQIACSKVTDGQLEELGEAVMSIMHPEAEEHAFMDRMMGGEGSATLDAMHRTMGARYLGCYRGGFMGRMMPGMMGLWFYGDQDDARYLGRPWWGMHHGYGSGMMGYGYGGVFMWLIIIILVIVIVYMIARGAKTKESAETPLDILKKRYAKGEISKEEFEEKKKDL